MAHQRHQSALMLLSSKSDYGPFLKSSYHFGASTTKEISSLPPKVRMMFPELTGGESVQQFKKVVVKGVDYRKDSVIMTLSGH